MLGPAQIGVVAMVAILLGWMVLSVATGLLLGPVLKANLENYPAVDIGE